METSNRLPENGVFAFPLPGEYQWSCYMEQGKWLLAIEKGTSRLACRRTSPSAFSRWLLNDSPEETLFKGRLTLKRNEAGVMILFKKEVLGLVNRRELTFLLQTATK